MCDYCEKVFSNEMYALQHERLQHGISANETTSSSLQSTKIDAFITKENIKESSKNTMQDGNKALPDALTILRSFLTRRILVQKHANASTKKLSDDIINVDTSSTTTKCAIVV